tara:strand:+ start:638 stop:886 length:249 start_codon:yes stop_codon:yes gene_type:complete
MTPPAKAVKSGIKPPSQEGAFFNLVGWLGAGLMVAFSFTMLPLFGITGLAALTVQATQARLFNLVILNCLSIIGLTVNVLGG